MYGIIQDLVGWYNKYLVYTFFYQRTLIILLVGIPYFSELSLQVFHIKLPCSAQVSVV